MSQIIRRKSIKPPSQPNRSKKYAVDTTKVSKDDVLIICLSEKDGAFNKDYKLNGDNVFPKKRIQFSVKKDNGETIVTWINSTPIEV